MKSAFEQWPAISDRLRQADLACLFLDYDGTLTPIVETPDKALLSDVMRNLLRQLAQIPSCRVAVISGRGLDDLKSKVGVEELAYIGNHGFQIEGEDPPSLGLTVSKFKSMLENIRRELEKAASGIQGILIEDKGMTLSVHYRLVVAGDEVRFIKIFRNIAEPYLKAKDMRLVEGKKVFELRPAVEWDKGKAAVWFLQQQTAQGAKKIVSVYIGDDTTDEDAFRDLKDGINVVVGKKENSLAGYFLQDTADVQKFLSEIGALLKENPHAP